MTTTPVPTPMCDKLSANGETRQVLVDFLEWLTGQQIVLQSWSTNVTTIHNCEGDPKRWMSSCSGKDCQHCDGKGYTEHPVSDRFLPIAESFDQLVMKFLGIDTVQLEVERRALLTALREG